MQPAEEHDQLSKGLVVTPDVSPVSVDSLLARLGVLGRYQIVQAILQLLCNLTIAFQLLNVVFIARDVSHTCREDGPDSDNATVYSECEITTLNMTANTSVTSMCDSWEYSEGKGQSIVSQWDLVCQHTALGRLPQTLFVIGQGIGALVFSILSDMFGRKPVMLVSHLVTAGFGIAQAFSPNVQTFMVLRMVDGAFQQGVVVTLSTMILEIYPRSKRVEVATFSAIVWSTCPLLLTLVSFLLRYHTWQTLQLVFSAMSFGVLLQLIFLDESLRWLVTNSKIVEAEVIIKKASKQNGVDASDIIFSMAKSKSVTQQRNTIASEARTDVGKYTFLDIFRSRFMLKISLIIWITWMVDSLTYFSLYLTSSSLADDFYINFLLNSLAEIPVAPLFWFLSRRIGRRKFFWLFHIISGVCLLIATAIRNLADGGTASVWATVFAFLGKVGNATCFTSFFVIVPELYPTNLRVAGLGAGSTAARIGAAMAPFTSMLVKAIPWLPGTIFGVACLVVAFLGLLLPEPEGRELPGTIGDIRAWGKDIVRVDASSYTATNDHLVSKT